MAGPWEHYESRQTSGPWVNYERSGRWANYAPPAADQAPTVETQPQPPPELRIGPPEEPSWRPLGSRGTVTEEEAAAQPDPARDYKREAAFMGQSLRRGSTRTFDLLQGVSDRLADTLGMPKTPQGLFGRIADLSRVRPDEEITPAGLVDEITDRVYGAIGGDLLPILAATHAGGAKVGFGALSGIEAWQEGKPLWEIAKAVVKGTLEGAVYQAAGVLTRPARVGTMATIAGGQAALEGGSAGDIAGAATTIGLLAATHAGGVGPRQAIDDLRKYGGVDIRGKVEQAQKTLKSYLPERTDRGQGDEIAFPGPLGQPEAQTPQGRPPAAPGGAELGQDRTPRPGLRRGSAFLIEHPQEEIDFEYDVVSLGDLVRNHPSIQTTRNRSRFAGTEQEEANARKFHGPRFLAGNTEIDRGLPIVGPADNLVESGNGRSGTLLRLKHEYPEKWQAFTDLLRSRAEDFGLTAQAFEGIQDPVVVRRRLTPDADLARIFGVPLERARAAFADDANARSSLGLSAAEQATSDARRINEATIANLKIAENGSIDSSLDLMSNRPIIGRFFDALPAEERGTLLDAKGGPTPEGKRRLKVALLAWVFPTEDGARLVQAATEAPEGSGVRNVETGLFSSLARLAELKTRVGRGDLGDFDITGEIPEAVATLARIRARDLTVDDYFKQQEIGRADNPVVEQLTRAFAAAKSAKQVRDFLGRYIDNVESIGDPKQVDALRTGPMPSKEDVLRAAQKRTAAEAPPESPPADEPAGQGAMFSYEPAADSVEAINRVRKDKAAGAAYFREDVRTSRAQPIPNTVDRVDVRPGKTEVIYRRNADSSVEIVDQGEAVRPFQRDRILAREAERAAKQTREAGAADAAEEIRASQGEPGEAIADVEGKAAAMDEPQQPRNIAEQWLREQQARAANTPEGRRGPDQALEVVAERIRTGTTEGGPVPEELREALELLGPEAEPTTGERWHSARRLKEFLADQELRQFERDLETPDADAISESVAPANIGPSSAFSGPATPARSIDRAALIKKAQIVRNLATALNVPIRRGHFGRMSQRVRGFFRIQPEVIRARLADDIRTISHEIGHFLDKTVFGHGKIKGSTFKQFESELLPIATQPRAGQSPTPEGFAEFVAMYVTDPARANQAAPRTYAFFDGKLQMTHPEIRETLLKARADYRRWQDMPDVAKVFSMISVTDKTAKGIKRTDIYGTMIEDLNGLKVLTTAVAGKERRNRWLSRIPFSNLPALDNPHIVGLLVRGWMGKADSWINRGGQRDFHSMRQIGPNYETITAPVVEYLDEYRTYMVARHAKELRRVRPMGELGRLAPGVVVELEARYPIFKEVFDQQRTLRQNLTQYLVDAGVLKPESKAAMDAKFEDYVPMYRLMEQEVGGLGGNGATFANLFDPVRRLSRHESGLEIIDPIESDLKNIYSFINVAERAQVGRALWRLAGRFDGVGKFLEIIPRGLKPVAISAKEFERILWKYARREVTTTTTEKLGKTTTTTGEQLGPGGTKAPAAKIEERVREALLARGFSTGETEQFINRLKGAKNETERTTIIKEVTEKIRQVEIKEEIKLDLPDEIVEIFRPSMVIPKDEPIVQLFRRGKQDLMRVSPEVYAAINNLDIEALGTLVKALSLPARMLRAGATSFSTEFPVRNVFRDQITALIYSRYGYNPVHFVPALYKMLRGADEYLDFEVSGALHAAVVSMDREYLQKGVRDITEHRLKRVAGALLHPKDGARLLLDLAQGFSELTEKPTRFAEYRLAKKAEAAKGVTGRELEARAGYAAREVSVDFARHGAKMGAARALVAFLGPGIQGYDRMFRAMDERPLGMAFTAMASITLPSLLLWYANEDDGRVAEVPGWQKRLSWIITTKHVSKKDWARMTSEEKADFSAKYPIHRLPKPFEVGILFGTVPEMILDNLTGRARASALKQLKQLGQNLALPGMVIGPDGTPIPAISATLPLIENAMNWSSFTDRPIVPHGKEDLEAALQLSGHTSPVAARIGAAIGYSGAKIENLIRGWLGAGGLMGLEGVDAAFRAVTRTAGLNEIPEPAGSLADIPMIRGWVSRFPSANAESIQTFYDVYGASQRALKSFDEYKRAGRVAEAQAYLDGHPVELQLAPALSLTAETLTAYRKIGDHIRHSKEFTPEQKRRALDATVFSMIDLARTTLDQIYASQKITDGQIADRGPIEGGPWARWARR